MKIRKDFVTNSSSSSFICEICGHTETVFDASIEDVGMYECLNGHTFCQDEALDPPSKKDMLKYIFDNELNEVFSCYWNGGQYFTSKEIFTEEELEMMDEDQLFSEFYARNAYEIPVEMCPICQFIEYSEYDLSAYLLKKYEVPREEVFAEVKKLNKRRRKLYESEYITYVCKKFDLNPSEIVSNWKKEFGTYERFKRYLRTP